MHIHGGIFSTLPLSLAVSLSLPPSPPLSVALSLSLCSFLSDYPQQSISSLLCGGFFLLPKHFPEQASFLTLALSHCNIPSLSLLHSLFGVVVVVIPEAAEWHRGSIYN